MALVGASEAGKSTLSKLLFRFYDPTKGAVEIDGTDIRSVSLDSVRRALRWCPRTACSLTTRCARIFATASATDEEVAQAIEAAYLKKMW